MVDGEERFDEERKSSREGVEKCREYSRHSSTMVTVEKLASKNNRCFLGGRVQEMCLIVGRRDCSQIDACHPALAATLIPVLAVPVSLISLLILKVMFWFMPRLLNVEQVFEDRTAVVMKSGLF